MATKIAVVIVLTLSVVSIIISMNAFAYSVVQSDRIKALEYSVEHLYRDQQEAAETIKRHREDFNNVRAAILKLLPYLTQNLIHQLRLLHGLLTVSVPPC